MMDSRVFSVDEGENATQKRGMMGKIVKCVERVLEMETERPVLSIWKRETLRAMEEMRRKEDRHVEEILKLETENKKLESEKVRAEMEVAYWKKKCAELETRSSGDMNAEYRSGIKVVEAFCEAAETYHLSKMKDEDVSGVEDTTVQVAMGPSSASGVVEILDSEEEMKKRGSYYGKQNRIERSCSHRDGGCETCSNKLPKSPKLDRILYSRNSSPDEHGIQAPTPKRKRMASVVLSESEDTVEEPQEIPGGKIKAKNFKDSEVSPSSSSNCSIADGEKTELKPHSRRHLVPLSQLRDARDRAKRASPGDGANSTMNRRNMRQRLKFPTLQASGNDDGDEKPTELESGKDNLDGFLGNESNPSDDEFSSNYTSSEQDDSSDLSGSQIFGRNCRGSSHMKWEYEGDMLASFGKDPVICMKAVCALYRQQTSDEKSFKGSLLTNNRGFNRIDAKRASYVAEFLTDGDAAGPLVKSVDDLQAYDPLLKVLQPEGVEYCCKLATHYSKQLFKIYQSGEDPHFCIA